MIFFQKESPILVVNLHRSPIALTMFTFLAHEPEPNMLIHEGSHCDPAQKLFVAWLPREC